MQCRKGQKGDLKGYGTEQSHLEGIANILSLEKLQKKYKVTYDSSAKTSSIVHKADSTDHVFASSK